MTEPTHILNDDLLMGFATGALPHAFDLVIATHVSLSDESRARLEAFESIGGAVLEDVGIAEIARDSLDRTLAKIADKAPTARRNDAGGLFPAPLRTAVGGDQDAVAWRNVAGGVKQCVLHSDEGGTARLLLIPAGRAMPAHSHHGTEMTLVLKGAYRDDDGRFARGDIEVADTTTSHQPIAEPGEDCICLVATDAKLKFRGLLPRIAQPFIGI